MAYGTWSQLWARHAPGPNRLSAAVGAGDRRRSAPGPGAARRALRRAVPGPGSAVIDRPGYPAAAADLAWTSWRAATREFTSSTVLYRASEARTAACSPKAASAGCAQW